jgi:O-antigen/teichoic acid export membrane protein
MIGVFCVMMFGRIRTGKGSENRKVFRGGSAETDGFQKILWIQNFVRFLPCAPMHQFFKDKLVKNSVILSVGTVVAGVFGYFFQFVISRGLTVAEYGEFQSLNSLSLMTGAVSATLGYFFLKFFPIFWKTGDYVSHRAFLEWIKEKIKKWIFVYAGIFLVLTPIFAMIFHLTDYYGLLFIIIAALIGVYGSIYNSALIGWEHFLPAVIAAIIAAAGKFIAGYFIVLFFPSASAVLFSFVIGASVGLIAYIFLHKRYFSGGKMTEVNPEDWKQKYYAKFNFRREVRHVFIFTLLITALGNIDILLVKILTSAELTGLYGALHVLGTIILTVNAAVIGSVLPSVYAEGHEGKKANAKTIWFAYGAIALASACGSIVFAAFPDLMVRMLFGAKYLSVAGDLWLFGPLTFFLSVLTLEANFAYARHTYWVSFLLFAAVALATVGVALFHGSIHAIALVITASFACGYISVLWLNWHSGKKRFLEDRPLAGI